MGLDEREAVGGDNFEGIELPGMMTPWQLVSGEGDDNSEGLYSKGTNSYYESPSMQTILGYIGSEVLSALRGESHKELFIPETPLSEMIPFFIAAGDKIVTETLSQYLRSKLESLKNLGMPFHYNDFGVSKTMNSSRNNFIFTKEELDELRLVYYETKPFLYSQEI